MTNIDEEKRLKRNEWQREYRKKTGNKHTKDYEKTVDGFLMRMYRNMKSRVSGIQKSKQHLYIGKPLDITKEDFYLWAKCNEVFLRLFSTYTNSGYVQKLAPTVDRVDSCKGYSFDNVEWVTHSVNSSRGAINRWTNENTSS